MEKESQRLKAIIADDESLARNVIRKYLASFPQIEVVAECSNGLIALNRINELQPDLVFLDIQMPEMDGLSLLSEVSHLPKIIFTTAYNQYAIKAFDLNAVDYLLKPFTKERFALAIGKVVDQKITQGNLHSKIKELQHSINELLAADKKYSSRILIRGKEGYTLLSVNEIIWIEADSDYLKIHTREKNYLKSISMNELETKLDPQQFIRIHRSTIVNVSFIKDLKPYFNGEYHIYLTNGDKLKLSRSYKNKIKLIGDGTM